MLVPDGGDLIVQDGKFQVERYILTIPPQHLGCEGPFQMGAWGLPGNGAQWVAFANWANHVVVARNWSLQMNKGVMLFSLGY